MQTIYLTVALKVADGADPYETVAECDYSFSGDEIICSEIVEVFDANEQRLY